LRYRETYVIGCDFENAAGPEWLAGGEKGAMEPDAAGRARISPAPDAHLDSPDTIGDHLLT
jgi:hypothetical protein